MSPEIAEAFSDSFVSHRDSFGVSITINGQNVIAIVNESQFARELMEGGFADDSDIEVKFLISDLSEIPAIGKSVLYRSRSFKVSRLGIQPGSLVGEITCRPAKR
jgi:hypothetical protein